jgi:hypothetical protein
MTTTIAILAEERLFGVKVAAQSLLRQQDSAIDAATAW